jgi:hypothetical protein
LALTVLTVDVTASAAGVEVLVIGGAHRLAVPVGDACAGTVKPTSLRAWNSTPLMWWAPSSLPTIAATGQFG